MKDTKERKKKHKLVPVRAERRALDEMPLDAGARADKTKRIALRLAGKARRQLKMEAKAKRMARKKPLDEKEGALSDFLGESFFCRLRRVSSVLECP